MSPFPRIHPFLSIVVGTSLVGSLFSVPEEDLRFTAKELRFDDSFDKTKEETFHWETGSGWFGERIKLPPGFALTMSWKGIEEIRFAPGMFKPDQSDFFSYALVFSLDPKTELNGKTIREQILLYYQGLSSRVSAGKGRKVDVSKFVLALKPAGNLRSAPKQAKGATALTGKLDWIEPFATAKSQTLRLEIHAWNDEAHERAYLFVCASPQPPDTPIWKKLRSIRAAFTAK